MSLGHLEIHLGILILVVINLSYFYSSHLLGCRFSPESIIQPWNLKIFRSMYHLWYRIVSEHVFFWDNILQTFDLIFFGGGYFVGQRLIQTKFGR